VSKKRDSVYYFLGNITSHVLHALPLYKKLGGTFVVVSKIAQKEIEKYGVPVVCIDDRPYKWRRFGPFIKPVHHYMTIGRGLRKTVEFLNINAKVVIFYELYDFDPAVRLTGPKKIFLTHGNMLKSYMTMHPKRLEIIKQYDYMAALGPAIKQQLIRDGVDPEKLVDIGIARTDELVSVNGKVTILPKLSEELAINPAKKIVAYVPTFWGPSSVYTTGKEIVRNFPDNYTLIFRPHPQTPQKLIREYLEIIKAKPNVIYAPEGKYPALGLIEIFKASSAIIGDMSSVMLEAILVNKPLIFAYDQGDHRQDENSYELIKQVVERSQKVDLTNAAKLAAIIEQALAAGTDKAAWRETAAQMFYSVQGNSVSSISDFIKTLL